MATKQDKTPGVDFPAEILVTICEEVGLEPTLVVQPSLNDAAEPGEAIIAAKYKLVEAGEVVCEPAFVAEKADAD